MQERDYAGCCGLYCGLCPRFQSSSASRCHGCQLGEQHSYCSVWRCCMSKRGLHTCAECVEFPCERLHRVLGTAQGADSFISHKPALHNLERTRETGLEVHLSEQRERRLLLETLLQRYNEGRSMSFYCAACALMPPELVRQARQEMEQLVTTRQVDPSDIKITSKSMRSLLIELARQAGVDLRLRK